MNTVSSSSQSVLLPLSHSSLLQLNKDKAQMSDDLTGQRRNQLIPSHYSLKPVSNDKLSRSSALNQRVLSGIFNRDGQHSPEEVDKNHRSSRSIRTYAPSITSKSIRNNGTLVINRSDVVTIPGAIEGSGSVIQAGGGTTILTGNNSYSGGTKITSGTLQLGNGGKTGSITGNVTNNGILVFNRADDVTFAGDISGTGALRHVGTGTLKLTGNISITGGISVATGILQVGEDNKSALPEAQRKENEPPFSSYSSGGAVGTVVLTGSNTYSGTTSVSAGVLQLGEQVTTGSIVPGIIQDNGALVYSGVTETLPRIK